MKFKKLVGGGMLKMVNGTVPSALARLGYDSREVQEIVEYIDNEGTIEGAPGLQDEHLPVFDCAFKALKGTRTISPEGHIRIQPFLSGAISKTVNMPTDTKVEEVEDAYLLAWKLGVKALAIYRDGCKRTQPLNTSEQEADKSELPSAEAVENAAQAIAEAFDQHGTRHEPAQWMQPGLVLERVQRQAASLFRLGPSFSS